MPIKMCMEIQKPDISIGIRCACRRGCLFNRHRLHGLPLGFFFSLFLFMSVYVIG